MVCLYDPGPLIKLIIKCMSVYTSCIHTSKIIIVTSVRKTDSDDSIEMPDAFNPRYHL